MLSLAQQFDQWDGRSSADLAEIYESRIYGKGLVNELVEMLYHPRYQVAAAWLLNHHGQHQGIFTLPQIKTIYDSISQLESWQAKLNILQAMQYLPVPASHEASVEFFLRDCLTHDNKFVRAWAYNGLDLLARKFPKYRQEADDFMTMALRDEAASVKARIRQIQKSRPPC